MLDQSTINSLAVNRQTKEYMKMLGYKIQVMRQKVTSQKILYLTDWDN